MSTHNKTIHHNNSNDIMIGPTQNFDMSNMTCLSITKIIVNRTKRSHTHHLTNTIEVNRIVE